MLLPLLATGGSSRLQPHLSRCPAKLGIFRFFAALQPTHTLHQYKLLKLLYGTDAALKVRLNQKEVKEFIMGAFTAF